MSVPAITLIIPGPPQGQGRPRFNSKTGHAYTPEKTRTYAQLIQGEWIAAGRPWLPDGPYRLTVLVRHPRPPSHFRRDLNLSAAGRRAAYPGKPDLDNVVKGVLDALCAVKALPDDRYLVGLIASKEWWPTPEVYIEAWTRAVTVA